MQRYEIIYIIMQYYYLKCGLFATLGYTRVYKV